VPEPVKFPTKPEIARDQIRPALASDLPPGGGVGRCRLRLGHALSRKPERVGLALGGGRAEHEQRVGSGDGAAAGQASWPHGPPTQAAAAQPESPPGFKMRELGMGLGRKALRRASWRREPTRSCHRAWWRCGSGRRIGTTGGRSPTRNCGCWPNGRAALPNPPSTSCGTCRRRPSSRSSCGGPSTVGSWGETTWNSSKRWAWG